MFLSMFKSLALLVGFLIHPIIGFFTGLPGPHFAYVKIIHPGLPLFLFNYSKRQLHGIFEAASAGQMNINPYGWTQDGSKKTPFPAQVIQAC